MGKQWRNVAVLSIDQCNVKILVAYQNIASFISRHLAQFSLGISLTIRISRLQVISMNLSRRRFLRNSLLTAAALKTWPLVAQSNTNARVVGANGDIRYAVVGF